MSKVVTGLLLWVLGTAAYAAGHGTLAPAQRFADWLGAGELESQLSGYDGSQAMGVGFNWSGLPVQLDYPVAGGTLLRFQIADLGVNLSFQGKSREDSREQLRAYLLTHDELLGRIQRVAEGRAAWVGVSDVTTSLPRYDFDTQLAYRPPKMDGLEVAADFGASNTDAGNGISVQQIRAQLAAGFKARTHNWELGAQVAAVEQQFSLARSPWTVRDASSLNLSGLQTSLTLRSTDAWNLAGRNWNIACYVLDSRMNSSDLNSPIVRDELGMYFVSPASLSKPGNFTLRGGVAYIWSNQNHMVHFNVGYNF
ncbi:hypothetical protein KSF73_12315 [Burkholderiaceae bacterium DAT-1]|nr:hypothetical protein [Burkholderiaceae bacterium DAT-1]